MKLTQLWRDAGSLGRRPKPDVVIRQVNRLLQIEFGCEGETGSVIPGFVFRVNRKFSRVKKTGVLGCSIGHQHRRPVINASTFKHQCRTRLWPRHPQVLRKSAPDDVTRRRLHIPDGQHAIAFAMPNTPPDIKTDSWRFSVSPEALVDGFPPTQYSTLGHRPRCSAAA